MSYPTLPTIQLGDLLELKMYVYTRNQVGINVYWYALQDPFVSDDLYAALNDWFDQVSFAYVGLQALDTVIQNATLRYNRLGTWSQEYFSTEPAVNGSGITNLLPSQVSGIITRRVDAAGNSNRGRVYVPFPTINDQDADEHPTAAYVASLQVLADTAMPVLAPMVVHLNPWVPVLRNPGAVGGYRQLIQVIPHKKWATQRRRGDYGTPNT